MANPTPNRQVPPAPPYSPSPGTHRELPDSMRVAIALMWVGAGLSVVYTSVNDVINTDLVTAQRSFTTAGHRVLIGSAVFGVILQLGLWLWMIWKVRAGRHWARVLSTVFFGFLCLAFLIDLTRGSANIKALATVYFLVALSALIMLYRRESSAFFRPARFPGGTGTYRHEWRIRSRRRRASDFALRFGQPGNSQHRDPQPGFGEDPQRYREPPQPG